MELVVVALFTFAVVAVVLSPVAGRRRAPVRRPAAAHPPLDEASLDAEVVRYRAALRAGTLCDGCRYANPVESLYCADCGRRLSPVA